VLNGYTLELFYLTEEENGWSAELVDHRDNLRSDENQYPIAALWHDASGATVAYWANLYYDILLAQGRAGSWALTEVPNAEARKGGPALALDAPGHRRLAYTQYLGQSVYEVEYATDAAASGRSRASTMCRRPARLWCRWCWMRMTSRMSFTSPTTTTCGTFIALPALGRTNCCLPDPSPIPP
jgi:hypothetical protein